MRVKVREEARRVLRYEKKNRRNDVTGIERERERCTRLKKEKEKKEEGRREGAARRQERRMGEKERAGKPQ